jgi:ornithine cyclodeaminase/alanine dehydrogenase-like protein (mu-crystallin family)
VSTTAPSSVPRGIPVVSEDELRALVPLASAIEALRAGFRSRSQLELEGIARTSLKVPGSTAGLDGELLLMPAHGREGAGLKLVSVVRANAARGLPLIQGIYVLFAPDTLTPELLIDGAALTRLRTAALSGLATSYLARPDSNRLVVFGAGAQGRAHIEAMCAVLPISQVTIVGSSTSSLRALALVEEMQSVGIDARIGDKHSIRDADVVCTCTTSSAPVFDDADLGAGTHINAVGAYRLDMAELPAATLGRGFLVVESLSAALEEAGDVVAGISAGKLPETDFASELITVLSGCAGRLDEHQVTIFKSVGLSSEDLIVARAVADAAARK